MKPDNYFKVRLPGPARVQRTFVFETWSRRATLVAFDRAMLFAAAHAGRVSVCYPVTVAGPWSSTPVIVPGEAAPAPGTASPARTEAGLALFGEGGCF